MNRWTKCTDWINNFEDSHKGNPGLDSFKGKLYENFKMYFIPMLYKVFQNYKNTKHLFLLILWDQYYPDAKTRQRCQRKWKLEKHPLKIWTENSQHNTSIQIQQCVKRIIHLDHLGFIVKCKVALSWGQSA